MIVKAIRAAFAAFIVSAVAGPAIAQPVTDPLSSEYTAGVFYWDGWVVQNEALVAIAIDEKLGLPARYGNDAAGLWDRLSANRQADLEASGVGVGDLTPLLLRCMGSVDFEGLSADRLGMGLSPDDAPSLRRARVILLAAMNVAEAIARTDADRPTRDIVLDVIVSHCAADA